MKKHIQRALVAALLLSSASAVVAVDFAVAAPAPKKEETPPVRRLVGVPLNDAVKLVNEKKFDEALAKVMEADKVEMKTPYEEFMVSRSLGFIAINKMPQDFAAATTAYNRMVASGGAPEPERAAMYGVALRLNFQAKDYAKTIAAAKELEKIGPLDETGYQVLATSYYTINDFANTVTTVKAATAAKGGKGDADLLGLQLNAQAKLMDDAGYKQTLDQLATVSSQPEVWGQVMDFAFSTKNLGDHHLLNLYRLAMLVGTMRDTDYAAMATIDLSNGLPNEGKEALTKGMKTGELLAQANTMLANDQGTLPVLAAEAAKTTANGEIDVKLGESYMTYKRYDEAVAALQKGIEKGNLKDMADAQTTLGIALFNAGKKDEALAAFDKAAAGNTPAGAIAHTWGLFVRRSTTAA